MMGIHGLRRTGAALVLGVFAIGLLGGPAPARADKYKNEKLGFSLSYPKKWKSMLIAAESRYVVAEFHCNRPYEFNDGKTGAWDYHTPKLQVVIIPLSAKDDRGATVEKTEKGVKVTEAAPYRDLKEYMDKTLRSLGGFHFSAEEELEVGGREVRFYEVTVDKLVTGPKKVWGWGFYTEDAIYGLVGDSLANHEKKLFPEFKAAFKSFKLFQRTGTLPSGERTGQDITVRDDPKDANLSDEELEQKRRQLANREIYKAKDNLPKDWSFKETEHFAVVSHADSRYTKSVVAHAEALRGWLDKELGFIGNGYAGKIVLRICADSDESSAYQRSSGWRSGAIEVVTYQDKSGWGEWAMESLNRGIYRIWAMDKNPSLAWGAPSWISSGMSEFIEGARSKGRKVEFRPDTWEAVEMAKLRRDDALLDAGSFFTMTSEDLWADYKNHQQAAFFLRFLISGAGSKGKYKSVFSDYVKNLIFFLDEAEDDEAEDEKPAETEEEEDRRFAERQKKWRAQEADMLATLSDRTFAGWTDKQWRKFNSVYWAKMK